MTNDSISLLDDEERIINYFTQWDINQDIYIDKGNVATCPWFHFANDNMKEALGAEATEVSEKYMVRVPNTLLQEDLPINIWIYVINKDSSKTFYTFRVPVISRLKPPDYVYKDTNSVNDALGRINVLDAKVDATLKKIGNVTELKTENKTLVGAINELYDKLAKLT